MGYLAMPLHYYIWYSVRRLKYHRSLSLFATHQLKLSIWRGGGGRHSSCIFFSAFPSRDVECFVKPAQDVLIM